MADFLRAEHPIKHSANVGAKRSTLSMEFDKLGRCTRLGRWLEEFAVVAMDKAEPRLADTRRIFQNRLEYGPQVTGRRAYDAEHIGGGSLLF